MNSKAILQNIEPLNEMLMATSILSNNSSLKWKSDSAKII
jgi:hypothetical protein